MADELLQVRFASLDDAPRIQDFIREHWNENHAFARDVRLLLWQHHDRQTGRLNFVIAEKGESLLGLLGFIPTSHFDPALADDKYVWLALWKMRDDVDPPGLGMQLLFFLIGEWKPQTITVLGFTPQAFAIYRSLRFDTGTMQHFYYANPALQNFAIAELAPGVPRERIEEDAELDIVPMTSSMLSALDERLVRSRSACPRKTPAYFVNRYLNHPIYRYDMHAVVRGANILGVWVNRLIERPEGIVLRGIDCIVDPDGKTDWMLRSVARLVRESGAEYWDFYATGRYAGALERAGLAQASKQAVIPNHFEPFVRKNIDILYAHRTSASEQPSCVKGDADQDRPN